MTAAFFGGIEFLIMLGIGLFVFLLPIIALIDIIRNEFNGNDKLIWVLVVLLLPFLGSILYFVIGTNSKVRRY